MNSLTLKTTGPHAGQPVLTTGAAWDRARAAVILVHGRGASAQDMLPLVELLTLPGFIFLIPEAAGNLWYPNRYDSALDSNEPSLSSALTGLNGLIEQIGTPGIPPERVVLVGFSQGACICAEYCARHARRYGGVGVLAGGLIGPKETPRDYPGSLEDTPIFLGCSDPDPYFTPAWIQYSADALTRLKASVQVSIYPNLGHRINLEMLQTIRGMMEKIVVEET